MTRKSELLTRVPGLLVGDTVRTQEGHRIGRVIRAGESSFEVEQGLWRHRRFSVSYDEITSASKGSIYVAGYSLPCNGT